jgi:hypothetical protein
MTTPDIAGLCERLRAVESSREPSDWSGIRQVTTNWHRNPDGPEAADTLERQAAEIERLRTGLEKVAAYYETGHRVTEIARAALTGEDTASV